MKCICIIKSTKNIKRSGGRKMENLLLEIYNDLSVKECESGFFGYSAKIWQEREESCRKYSWAIPNEPSLSTLLRYSPIVELGCGTGYWSALLSDMGCSIVAIDCCTKSTPIFYPQAIKGNEHLLPMYPDHTLFLCWPPYDNPMAYNALLKYHGKHVVYIGEGMGGCTADDLFHEYLDNKFNCIEEIAIPQWCGVHDFMSVWEIKSNEVDKIEEIIMMEPI
jgi:hypothetical protein